MFWALISPLRKTADPPQLGPNSRIRLLFQRHGASIARHPVASIVTSILAAILFCYPFPFLSYNYPGFPSQPSHVWTSARPFSSTGSPPDIGIKQAWVQGSYMGALDRDVLLEALRIQRILGGTDRSCQAFASEHGDHHGVRGGVGTDITESYMERLGRKDHGVAQKSFFHSPLLYWNCSETLILSDEDLVNTVNQKSLLHSSANLTVLWGSVFAGKQIIHHRLVAADALVITLFYRIDSDAGDAWDLRASSLVSDKHNPERYDVYPASLDFQTSRMYEFRFMPMTTADNILLFVSYGLVAVYCVFTFRRVPTVKSRSGLFLAAMTQLAGSIMASFTIVSLLKLPVSHIPREFFPLVVIVVGSENIFRLTSAVIATSPEQPTTVRIANAVGEIGFVSSVAVLTDLSLLYFLGLVSVPAVREFCTFAAIALIVDFFLHFTYFLAVLSIDVRRLELQDSLEKANSVEDVDWGSSNRGQSPKHLRARISDVLFAGPHPISSRVAGTAILICFLFILNIHFFENESPIRLVHSFMDHVKNSSPAMVAPPPSPSSLPINIARTPQSWLRLQDHLTGMELIRATKPGAHRILAKVYDPMFFVLKGSTRAKSSSTTWDVGNFIDLHDLKAHFRPFVIFVVLTTAFLTLFMNHLLGGSETFEEEEDERLTVEKPLLNVFSLEGGHDLDVVRLASSSVGVVASVGLDRKIILWKLKGRVTPSKEEIVPACDEQVLWPVMAIVLDSYAEWLAIAPRTGPVSIWNVRESSFFKSISVDLGPNQPSAFFFAPRHEDREFGPRLIIIRDNGWMSEVYINSAYIAHHRIGLGITISSTHGVSTPPLPLKIVSASTQGAIYITAKRGGDWHTYPITVTPSPLSPFPYESQVGGCILPLQTLGMVACSRTCSVELVDVLAGAIVKRFSTKPFIPSTLRVFHAQRTTCLHCGCPSVTSFSLAYTEKDTGNFKMHTFTSTRIRDLKICLRAERNRLERKCVGFEITKEEEFQLESVEGWEPTALNMVAGVRRRTLARTASCDSNSSGFSTRSSGLMTRRRRGRHEVRETSEEEEEEDEWECWTMDCHGTVTTVPLRDTSEMSVTGGLLVSRAGPVSKIGTRSLAVGLGSTVKIICVGQERYEGDAVEGAGTEGIGRRRPHMRGRP